MSIFMISPKQEVEPVTDRPTVMEATPTGSEPSNDPETTETGITEPKELDEKTIVLDGPLSQVYTQALNQMYAKESYITELAVLPDLVKEGQSEEEYQALKDKTDYVYVINGPYLEEKGFVEAFESLRIATEKYSRVFVCVEHDYNITPNIAGFLSYARNNKAVVLNSRQQALEKLGSELKRS